MKKLLASAALLLCAIPAMAQGTKPIKVAVESDTSEGVDVTVRAAIIVQLSANPHYTLVSDSSWDVKLSLNCLPLSAGGDTCASVAVFMPDGYGGLMVMEGPNILTASSDANAANMLLSEFLKETTPDVVKKETDTLQTIYNNIYAQIMEYNKQHPQETASADKEKL